MQSTGRVVRAPIAVLLRWRSATMVSRSGGRLDIATRRLAVTARSARASRGTGGSPVAGAWVRIGAGAVVIVDNSGTRGRHRPAPHPTPGTRHPAPGTAADAGHYRAAS